MQATGTKVHGGQQVERRASQRKAMRLKDHAQTSTALRDIYAECCGMKPGWGWGMREMGDLRGCARLLQSSLNSATEAARR
eukprot:2100131-Pleurochrysis_carterae.AAC.1